MKTVELEGSVAMPELDVAGSRSRLITGPVKSGKKPTPSMGEMNVSLALRCPICQEPYSEPKQLNCGHSFCLTCLEGTQHLYSVNCPICRKATCFNVPGLNGLRLLPSNYALAQVVEAVVSRHNSDSESEDIERLNCKEEMESFQNVDINENKKPQIFVECAYCGRMVCSERAWFCADCDGGEKFCSSCVVDRHRGSHRCIQACDVVERWRAYSCTLDALNSQLTPVRTSLRQIACNMKNVGLKSGEELIKRSDYLCRANSLIEELLEKADAMRSNSADCERLIEFESLLKKLQIYASLYGAGRLTALKDTVDDTTDSLNKIIADVVELERSAVENENALRSPRLENVLVAWRTQGAKSVCLAGSFTEWKANMPLVEYKGEFLTTLQLPKGKHEFKFLVDNEWKQSSDYESCEDGCGGWNNYVVV